MKHLTNCPRSRCLIVTYFFHITAPGFHGDFPHTQVPRVTVALLGERRGAPDELLGSVVAMEIFVAARILAVGWSWWIPPLPEVMELMISWMELIMGAPSRKEGGGVCSYGCRSGWGGCGGCEITALAKLDKRCMMHILNFNGNVVIWRVTYGEPCPGVWGPSPYGNVLSRSPSGGLIVKTLFIVLVAGWCQNYELEKR